MISFCIFAVFIWFHSELNKDENNISFRIGQSPWRLTGRKWSAGRAGPSCALVGTVSGEDLGAQDLGFPSLRPHCAGHAAVQEGKDEAAGIQAAWMRSIVFGILKTLYTCQ